jgi:hypothetical protein
MAEAALANSVNVFELLQDFSIDITVLRFRAMRKLATLYQPPNPAS